jgi:hypothetical protein
VVSLSNHLLQLVRPRDQIETRSRPEIASLRSQ